MPRPRSPAFSLLFPTLLAACFPRTDLPENLAFDDVEAGPDTPDTNSDNVPDPEGDTDTDADGDADSDSDADADADTDSHPDTDGDADTDTDADSDTDADADSDADSDTDADADADGDSDADADADADVDIAPQLAAAFLSGAIRTHHGDLTGGTMGIEMIADRYLPGLRSVCSLLGDVKSGPRDLVPCEVCDWSFDVVIDRTVARGDHCDDFGLVDGDFDGVEMGIAWADKFRTEEYEISRALFLYSDSYRGWYLLSYDNGYGWNGGDEETATFHAPVGRYYYYYP